MTKRDIPEQIADHYNPARGAIPLRAHAQRQTEPQTRFPDTRKQITRAGDPQHPAARQGQIEGKRKDHYAQFAAVQQRSSPHQVGHEAGMHPEDSPYLTDDYSLTHPDDENYRPNRLPTSTRRYVPVRQRPTRVEEEAPAGGFNIPRLFVASLLLAFLWLAYIQPTINNWSNQQAYGYPRIFRVEANVGHGTKQYPNTRFIGVNNGGVIEVVELQEGAPTKDSQIHGYVITELVGEHTDLVPITSITFTDINGDGKLDMQVVINGTLYVLFNDGTVFKHQQQ